MTPMKMIGRPAALSAAAMTYPIVGNPVTVGAYQGQNPECPVLARSGQYVGILYSRANAARLKLFDLNSGSLGSEITTPVSAGSDYHNQGCLLSCGEGRFHVLNGRSYSRSSTPFSTWSSLTTLAMRSGVTPSLSCIDTSGCRDRNGHLLVTMQSNTAATSIDGIPTAPGQAAMYASWRAGWFLRSDGSANGPYMLAHAWPSTQTKGEVLCDSSGRLHFIWCNRFTASDLNGYYYFYNIYYAYSDDGVTWYNAAGIFSLPRTGRGISIKAYHFPGQIPDSLTPNLDIAEGDWSDYSNFKVWSGNVGQLTERALVPMPGGRVGMVVMDYISGGDTVAVADEYPNNLPSAPSRNFPADIPGSGVLVNVLPSGDSVYHLKWHYFNGSTWTTTTIDGTNNMRDAVIKPRRDKDGGLWVFAANTPGSLGLVYYRSTNNGVTWTGPTPLRSTPTAAETNAGYLYSYEDPVDINMHHLAYDSGGTRYYVPVRLTA